MEPKESVFSGITFIETTAVPDGLAVCTCGNQMIVIDMREPAPPQAEGGRDE